MEGRQTGIEPIPVNVMSSSGTIAKSWLTESGRVELARDFKKPKILVVETAAGAGDMLRWLRQKYEVHTSSSNEQAARTLMAPDSEFQLIIAACKTAKIDAFSLLNDLLQHNCFIPMLVLLSESMVLTGEQEKLYEVHDVLRKPISERMLMQRVQKTLELHQERTRNQAYRQYLEENLTEVHRLRQLALEKESETNEVLSALEAPIVAITGALAKVLETPDLKNSDVRNSLEEIMKLMTGDVYRPALERVLTSDMDPLAISLLQEYWRRDFPPDEPHFVRKKSSMVASRTGTDDLEMLGLHAWSFNVWEHDHPTLRHYLKLMFLSWHTTEFVINETKLESFLREVEQNYLDNPYHCFRHAFDVTQTLYVILGELEATHMFSHFEVVSMLIAALCHDIGHLGKTNKFLVDTQHRLALLYNDHAVLEQYHCSKAFDVLLKPQNNFLSSLDRESYRECRSLIIESILGTDMSEHFSLLGKLEAVGNTGMPRELLLKTLVHFADISNVAKAWPLAYKWSTLITTEFFAQGDAEKKLGLPVEAFMDRTRSNVETNTYNFIRFVCRKFFTVMSNAFPVLAKYLQQMDSNAAEFERLSKASGASSGPSRSQSGIKSGAMLTPPTTSHSPNSQSASPRADAAAAAAEGTT